MLPIWKGGLVPYRTQEYKKVVPTRLSEHSKANPETKGDRGPCQDLNINQSSPNHDIKVV